MSSGVQPPAEYAFWRTPDAAITVVYSLALFHEIDFVVNEGYRRIPHGGVEVGGLLFGRSEASRVRIQAFRGIECEHAFGPSFVLSDRDLDRLETQLSNFAGDPELAGLEPVGWLVAHSRSALEMSDREVSWFDRFFPEPGRVAVLAKPERFQPTRFAFVIRRWDGQLQRAAATDAIILPLAGRARGPQDGQTEDGFIPSLSAPATQQPPSRPATPPERQPEVLRPVQPPSTPQVMEPPSEVIEPAPELAQPVVDPPPPQANEPVPPAPPPQPAIAPMPPILPEAAPEPAPSMPIIPAVAARDIIPPAAPVSEPPLRPLSPRKPAIAEQGSMHFEKPSVPPPPVIPAKGSETPTRVVPPHGVETRPLTSPPAVETPRKQPEREQPPLKWPTVPKTPTPPHPAAAPPPPAREYPVSIPLDETVEMPRIAVPGAQAKPATPADEIWRQRVEALPLRPAPPSIAPANLPLISREPGRITRGLNTSASARPRLAFMFLIAALLGCSVGYYAYLQLPPPVIPLTVHPQGSSLVVSWPPAQTQHVSEATLQVGPSQPVLLSNAQRSAGEAAVSASGDDIKIELVAHHWPRDSRGIVRFVRSPASPARTQ
jgi:hypothetical protein